MVRDAFLEEIYAALWRLLKRRRGSVRQIEQALGQCRNYLWTQRERNSFKLTTLLEVLHFLKISPSWFFRFVIGGETDPVEDFIREAQTFLDGRQVPAGVRQVEARSMSGEHRNEHAPDESEHARLSALEEERQSQPDEAAEKALALALHTDSPGVAARSLGIMASALRVDVDRLEDAQIVLATALQIARHHDDRQAEARLLLRGCYILSDRSFPERGLALADAALVLYSELKDSDGQGRSHVERAAMLVFSGKSEKAQCAYEAALGHLDPERSHYRAAAYQGLGYCSRVASRLVDARRYFELAGQIVPANQRCSRGRLRWEVARLETKLGKLSDAIDSYRSAMSFLENLPVDSALAGAEMARILVQVGRQSEAREVCLALKAVLFQLEERPAVQAALMRLYRAVGEQDTLPLALLDSVIVELVTARVSKLPAFDS